MTVSERRFRRVMLHRNAELEVHLPLQRLGHGAVPVTIRSITCEGAGLRLPEHWDMPLRRGDAATLKFATHEHPLMTLPATVAWYGGPNRTSAMDVGLRFRFDAAGVDMAGRYADWIVDLLTAVTNQELELGAVLVRVAGLPLRTLQAAIDSQRRLHKPLADILLEMNAVTDYDLRLAARCQIHQHGGVVPPGLLRWKEQVRAGASAA